MSFMFLLLNCFSGLYDDKRSPKLMKVMNRILINTKAFMFF